MGLQIDFSGLRHNGPKGSLSVMQYVGASYNLFFLDFQRFFDGLLCFLIIASAFTRTQNHAQILSLGYCRLRQSFS